ncbi:mechanosensitive ion channel family protein [Thalassotalea fonticola]|uniref:Small-conductance mechanosensitive channel n=1 Tax=Thalassotalea fonticola TaxID=3065649 RepID=A0ABZ0GV34_9GAMM|nr:mechanosensitive ion channel family protein [Colwelliaceae bacterium S1-1]
MTAATSDSTTSTSDTFKPTDFIKEELDLVNQFYEIAIEFFANYTFQLIGAFLIFLIGYFIAGKVSQWVLKLCERHKLDVTLSRFIASATKMILVLLITIVALGKLGISITPFIATLGALSLGVGLALQGLLANYAAGFNIILIRPFVVGDTIKVQGVSGIVKEVLLAYTILVDEDGVEITIPNKHIVGEVLHNSSHDSLMELKVGIAYEHNPLEVINMLTPIIENIHVCSKHKKPQLGIDEFADSAIVIGVRLWVPTVNFYASKYQAYATIYEALDAANIKIPYPQRDVHMISGNK